MISLYKNLIRPYKIYGDYIRYGRNFDGGYIINKNYLQHVNRLYSYGLADDISFENHILNDNKHIIGHLYDHTIDKPKNLIGNAHFHKEGLSLIKENFCNNLFDHIKENKDLDAKIILKIDIEGAELEYFDHINLDLFSNVVQMAVEFHSNINFQKYIKSLIKINEYFYCCHIHGNNGGGILLKDKDQLYSEITEFTFINKKYVDYIPLYNQIEYPIKNLDQPNLPDQKDFFITFNYL